MSNANRNAIVLVPLAALDADSQLKVREIRNEENVRKWMYTDHVIGLDEHLAWLKKVTRDDRQMVFVVMDRERGPLGVVSAGAIDRLHKKADWAYYLTETARGGLGSAVEYAFINFIFDDLGLEKLNGEVIEGNDAVIRLHKKFQFQIEGFRRSNIIKNGVRIGVYLLGLTKEDWLAAKSGIHEKYGPVFDKFSVAVHQQ